MQKLGSPERFKHMVRQLHDGMMACVTDKDTSSEALTVTNGVNQSCVLPPTPLSIIFSVILVDAYRDELPRRCIDYRTDGHLLNSRRMQTSTCLSTVTIDDLLFADNCALNGATNEKMQRSKDVFTCD
nr:unnamed protein product [Spirometra erinaceieuropaei]